MTEQQSSYSHAHAVSILFIQSTIFSYCKISNSSMTLNGKMEICSFIAAVHGEYAAPPCSGSLYSEQDYNETSTVENGQAYHMSKVGSSGCAYL